MKYILICTLSFALLIPPTTALAESPEDILIIANNAIDENKIDLDTVRAFFLKQRSSWPGGQAAVPFNAKPGTKLRSEFQKRVLGMSQSEEAGFWEKAKLTGAKSEPADVNDGMKAVFKLKGAISYVFRSDFKPGVAKIVAEVLIQ